MRKQLCAAILASFLLLAGCAGGNTADQADTTPMSEEEIAQMYSDPEQFVGRSLELCGQVFTSPEYDDTAVYFQMWADPTNGDWNTVVAYNDSSFQLEADDYVRVSGVVQDVYEGENMMGGTIVAPMITADSVEVISYKEAVAPTLYEATIDQPAQTQLGYSVELQAVELAEKETRVYVSVTNQGSASFSLYTFDAKIVQNGKQYEESDNWDANYPEIQTDLLVGSSTEGVIVFPAIEQADFDVILEASSDNWDENIQPYTFHCTFSTGSAGTISNNTTSETVVNTVNYLLYSNATTQSAGLVLSGSSLGSAYLWPTDTQTITDNDLQKLTQTEVSAVRNEIYARHGYPFTSAEWSAFFDTASWYQANDAYSNDMKKRILSLLTACVLLLGTTPAAFAALSNFISERSYAGQFTDVPASAWYYENVKTAYELGLVNGSSASTYSPDDNITVAEVQTLVARIHSTYYGNTIAPVSGAWYTPYIEYCIEHIDREICSMAYMQDGGRVFADTPASRTYFAYLMYAALPYSEYTQINTIVNGALPDVDDIVFMDADARIYTLYRAGILTGSDAYGTFNPDTNITRAEVAAIVSRMIDPTQRISFTLQGKPQTISLDAYLGDWYFNQYPDCGLSIEKIGDEYYLSLTVVQGNGLRFNGTMEPARLIDQGSYFSTAPFFTMQATTAVAQIRPQGSQLVVSCPEEGVSGLSLNMSGEICSRR